MTRPDMQSTDTPIEARLRRLLPEKNGGAYIGRRTVKLTVEELEEVIATLDYLRDGRPSDEGMSD